jgi:hypothetical protein
MAVMREMHSGKSGTLSKKNYVSISTADFEIFFSGSSESVKSYKATLKAIC